MRSPATFQQEIEIPFVSFVPFVVPFFTRGADGKISQPHSVPGSGNRILPDILKIRISYYLRIEKCTRHSPTSGREEKWKDIFHTAKPSSRLPADELLALCTITFDELDPTDPVRRRLSFQIGNELK